MSGHYIEEKLLNEIESLEERFDKHLEIYKNNGIESKRVADALVKLLKRSDIRDIKVDAMYLEYTESAIIAKVSKKWREDIVLWGRVLTAVAIVGTALSFLLGAV